MFHRRQVSSLNRSVGGRGREVLSQAGLRAVSSRCCPSPRVFVAVHCFVIVGCFSRSASDTLLFIVLLLLVVLAVLLLISAGVQGCRDVGKQECRDVGM